MEVSGRSYPLDSTDSFSRGELEWQYEIGRQGASTGASGLTTWDNNPRTPESSGRVWDQIGGKTIERTGAGDLERDGASQGLHLGLFGTENDHRFNPEGLRYERNEYVGAGAYWERDVLGLMTYDPPAADIITTNKLGIGIGRSGLYGSITDHEKYGSRGDQEKLDPRYRGVDPGTFDDLAREKAAVSHAQLSLPARSTEVLQDLNLSRREAYLSHIEDMVATTKLPADMVVDRMHFAVHQAGVAMDNDPTKSAAQAFSEQPPIDRRTSTGQALRQALSPGAALDPTWSLDLDPRYRGAVPGTFDDLAREKAAGTHAHLMTWPEGSAAVLQDLELDTEEAYLSHIEETVATTKLPADVIIDRMQSAVIQAGVTMENDPTKSAAEAFAEQPPIDRRESLEQALSQGLSPAAALDVALARAQGDLRPFQEILSDTSRGSIPKTAHFADDALAFEGLYSRATGARPDFDAIVAAGDAHRAGDVRSAGALVTDYHDNGKIDGSNLVNVRIGAETYAVIPGGDGVQMVSQSDGTVAPVETMRPDTARALLSMVDVARKQEWAGQMDIAESVVEDAALQGASIEEQKTLYSQALDAQQVHGDTRNTDALIADSRDNGLIDGSNLPEARVGDQTYAISEGGGVMHERTTMTPSEITARANAHAANGGEVDGGMVAKARADAMGQSLRDGFSAREQISVDDRALSAPGDRAAAMRRDLEAMVDQENGVVLDARERKALDGMITEVRGIEEAARFEAAKGVADAEYDLAMQMQEQRALDDMIAEANRLEELAEVPIPAFKPSSPGNVRSGDDDGPDMRGDEVAYGRGTVFTDRTGRQHVAFESFSDWGAAIRDSFNGNPARVGVAIPNAREIAEQKAAQEQEGGENRGQQGGDVPEAGSKENDAATSAEFDAMGSGSNAGPDKDEADKGNDKASTSGRDDHEPGENNGADIGGSNDANDNYGAPSDGIY